MIATVTKMTADTILSSTFEMFATSLDLITIVLLCVLLAEKELMRAYHRHDSFRPVRVLDMTIVPLLLTFGLIVIKNLVNFLGLLK